ncbi:MAG: DNA methylase [Planctomycetes bacterium]|nr:DNA methylase [Planctomycetota bacterium]MBU4400132.1 DNA methylase [Planctomycetota bacterium]
MDSSSPRRNYSPVSKERLPTNTTTYRHPVHRWFNFIAGFSPEFMQICLDQLDGKLPRVLLDPFAGCATALVSACQYGLEAVGCEPHPILTKIGRAKLPGPDTAKRLWQIEVAIAAGLDRPQSLELLSKSPQKFLSSLFSRPILESLLGARESLRQRDLFDNDLAFLVLSKVVDKSSHSQTDGIYKAPASRKVAIDPLKALRQIVTAIREDLDEVRGIPFDKLARIIEKSSERIPEVADGSVGIVVTSPPYLNNFDFAEMTRMFLYFWGIANSWGEITDKVRAKLVVNTTTALKGHKEKQDQYRIEIPSRVQEHLSDLVSQLAVQRRIRAGKKEYDFLVYPYFAQITAVLRECYRCMANGAAFHMMVADAALYGIHISAPQFIRDILEEIGFRNVTCSLVRTRGYRWILEKRDGSKQGLGEYHIAAIK